MTTIKPTDPAVLLAGIKQFGLAPDGSDLQDLKAAIIRLQEENARADLDEAVGLLRQVRSRMVASNDLDWEAIDLASDATTFLSRMNTQEGKSDD